MSNGRKLVRSKNKVLSGVLAGIAEYLDVDPTVVRVVYLVLTVFTAFSGVILYPLLWLVIPEDR